MKLLDLYIKAVFSTGTLQDATLKSYIKTLPSCPIQQKENGWFLKLREAEMGWEFMCFGGAILIFAWLVWGFCLLWFFWFFLKFI